jgi:hypothetical protein
MSLTAASEMNAAQPQKENMSRKLQELRHKWRHKLSE